MFNLTNFTANNFTANNFSTSLKGGISLDVEI